MRYKLLAALVFISCGLQAQQINPVPDYVFQNRMSVGRTTVTDTLAYFSMGPRYGAIRGFMPPMVVDTALVTGGTKRNGLTIFSIQKNKYVYWDSVGSKWAEMAGTGGSAINSGDTASMLTPYPRGSGTTNYLPKFTGTRTFGNSQIFDNGTNVGINTTSASQKLQVKGSILADSSITATGDLKVLQGVTTGFFNNEGLLASHNGSRRVQMRYLAREHLFSSGQVELAAIFIDSTANVGIGTSSPTSKLFVSGGDFNVSGGSIIASTPATANNTTKNMLALLAGTDATNGPTAIYIDLRHSTTGTNRRVDIYSADNTNYRNISFPYAELLVGSTTDAGAYALQVAGSIYNTTGAVFAVSSGNVGIGTTSPLAKFDVRGNVNLTLTSGTNFTLNGSSGDVNQAFDVDLGKGGGNYNYLKFRYNNYNVITWGRSLTEYANKLTINSPEGPDAIISLQTLNLDRMFVSNSGEIILNSSNTDAGDYKLQVTGAIYNTTTLTTGAPTSGSAKPWRLGEAATVSPTSPNRTIRVEIDGTVYYIHAKTTND